MAYATYSDVQSRMNRTLSASEQSICNALLEDAGIIIDKFNSSASEDVKKVVSCRMVMRALGDGETTIPMGASQGSQSGLGYSESWTMGSGTTGELYLGKLEKELLGTQDKIGSYSPLEDITGGESI